MNLNEHAAKIEKAALDVSHMLALPSVWDVDSRIVDDRGG